MSSWINDATAGSLMPLSLYTPALISRSTSSAVRFARCRHNRAAASASPSAPNDPPSAVAVASMIVPIAPHQLIDLEDHDAHLQTRSKREQHHPVLRDEAALLQILAQRNEMRRRRGVAQLIDGDHRVLRR